MSNETVSSGRFYFSASKSTTPTCQACAITIQRLQQSVVIHAKYHTDKMKIPISLEVSVICQWLSAIRPLAFVRFCWQWH